MKNFFRKLINPTPRVFKDNGMQHLWDGFSQEEKDAIIAVYGKGGIGMGNIYSIDIYPSNVFRFLVNFLDWFNTHKYHSISSKVVSFIETNHLYDNASIGDIHFYYMALIKFYYRPKNPSQHNPELAQHFCESDVILYQYHLKELLRDMDCFNNGLDTIPNSPAFHTLAMIYETQEKYKNAIKVCELAKYLGIRNDTKTGWDGRINRIKKKMNA